MGRIRLELVTAGRVGLADFAALVEALAGLGFVHDVARLEVDGDDDAEPEPTPEPGARRRRGRPPKATAERTARGRVTGERLRRLRLRACLTQAELAERVGIRPAGISRYETGAREVSADTAAKLAPVLRCDPADLLYPSSTD